MSAFIVTPIDDALFPYALYRRNDLKNRLDYLGRFSSEAAANEYSSEL